MLEKTEIRAIQLGWPRRSRRATLSATIAVVFALSSRAQAEAPEPNQRSAANTPSDAAREVEAPALLEFVEAAYPKGALEQRVEARVVLSLLIDASGAVTEARVTEPAGQGFDEAALEATRRF